MDVISAETKQEFGKLLSMFAFQSHHKEQQSSQFKIDSCVGTLETLPPPCKFIRKSKPLNKPTIGPVTLELESIASMVVIFSIPSKFTLNSHYKRSGVYEG